MKFLLHFFFFLCCLFAACTTAKQTAKKNIEITKYSSQLPDSLSKKQTAGIDFFASGNSPANWTLELDFDKNFIFSSADGTQLFTQAVKPSAETNAATTYKATNPKGAITIIIYNEPCGKENTGKKTDFYLNDKPYTGCGKSLYDYRLNDNWILESVNNKILNPADFTKGLPHISFNLLEKKLTGTDGCNNISTGIEVEGNRIKFAPVASTKISCKNNSIQKIFSEKISNQTASYFFREGKLYLYLIDDSLLIFIKPI